jgi:hypothetical protein
MQPLTIAQIRLLYHLLRNLRLRPDASYLYKGQTALDAKGQPTHPIFAAHRLFTRTWMGEIDYNVHKSNSTYFTDLDISRTGLVTNLYSPGVGIMNREIELELRAASRDGNPRPQKENVMPIFIALGSVYCTFKREVKAFRQYEVRSQVASWDDKWMYIISYFLQPRSGKKKAEQQKNESDPHGYHTPVAAIAISKYVVKKGRITVSPERVLRASGFLPARPAHLTPEPPIRLQSMGRSNDVDSNDTSTLSTPPTGEGLISSSSGVDGSLLREVLKLSADQIPPQEVLEEQQSKNASSSNATDWSWERIDIERRRGLELVQAFSQLDAQLLDDWDA